MSDLPATDQADPSTPDVPLGVSEAEPRFWRPWGPWATLGWTSLCLVVLIAVQSTVLVILLIVRGLDKGQSLETFAGTSLVFSAATLTSTPIVIGLVWMLISSRGCPIRYYLALRWPSLGRAILAVAGLALLLAASDLLSVSMGRAVVPDVILAVYRSGWFPLLLTTLVVAAPLGEEVLFRGFLYEGIATSRWGPKVAIGLSSIAWACIHIQYDWYGIATIFVMGIFLGEVRRRTGSLPLTMILHAIANAVATIEMVVMDRINGG